MISACNARHRYGILLKNKGGAILVPGSELNREAGDERGVEVVSENY